jgi:hypothetical protein
MTGLQTLSRSEMKSITGGCSYSNCSCLSTYDCYRSMCLDVYGTTSDGMACVNEVNGLQESCIYDCKFQVQ